MPYFVRKNTGLRGLQGGLCWRVAKGDIVPSLDDNDFEGCTQSMDQIQLDEWLKGYFKATVSDGRAAIR